jgi:hypothetical protein
MKKQMLFSFTLLFALIAAAPTLSPAADPTPSPSPAATPKKKKKSIFNSEELSKDRSQTGHKEKPYEPSDKPKEKGLPLFRNLKKDLSKERG